ncbi:MAG: flagellar assembly peptidoglycan hydrolase FlgJ [Gammaproteobacteria bacterium]|nr:flagellar assembly peptidoglycan hydrolase FlgJ [Gammaproteobacteria bacterium]
MTMPIQQPALYTDLQGLNTFGRTADMDSPETLQYVAEQFEAIFLQMMLKSAHPPGGESGMFEGEQSEFYQDWYDKQLSISLASGRGVGIAEMLVQQLQRQGTDDPKTTEVFTPGAEVFAPRGMPTTPAEKTAPISPKNKTPVLDSPQAFVEQLMPLAKQAAEKLGISPEVLLAQAALETGWGKKISRDENDNSSYNLFNIKADGRWNGQRVMVSTLEYRDGVAVRERAAFRAYDSFKDSFDDFVNFLQQSPRYQKAISMGTNARAFTAELASAGYATDPDYASKIIRIVEGQPLARALDAIKL